MKNMSAATAIARVAALGFLLLCVALPAQEIRIDKPAVYPEDAKTVELIDSILGEAVFIANRLYPDELSATYAPREEGGTPAYTVSVYAVKSEGNNVLTLTMTRVADQAAGQPFNFLSQWTPALSLRVAQAVRYQRAQIEGFPGATASEPARIVEEFSTDNIPTASFPVQIPVAPYSLAVCGDGNLLVGAASAALELDRQFHLVDLPGKNLLEAGNYTFAYQVAVTPAGTVFMRPSSGAEINVFAEGSDRPTKIRSGVNVPGVFAVLRDGSIVLSDPMEMKAYRLLGRKKSPITVSSSPYGVSGAAAAGPDGNVWFYDVMDGAVAITSPEGVRLDSILPLVPPELRSAVKAMAVYDTGDLILVAPQELIRVRRDGAVAWRLKGSFTTAMSLAVDSARGLIYVADPVAKKITKLLDPAQVTDPQSVAFELAVLAINARLEDDPEDTAALAEKAELYESVGAFEAAQGLWETVLDLDPGDDKAADKLDAIEEMTLRAQAVELAGRTVELLDSLGPESARATYSRAVQAFEKLLYVVPEDEKSRGELARLKELFSEKEAVPRPKPKPLTIASIEIGNLFPSLMQYYRANPAGRLQLKNELTEEAKNVRASLFIRRYMDFPAESAVVASLRPGQEARIDLHVLFNTEIFQLEEDLPVQAQVSIRYEVGGEPQEVTREKAVTVYRRTTLSWDDSAKIASFVTPNESVVAGFALALAALPDAPAGAEGTAPSFDLSEKLLRSVRIVDGLGAYGINYVEDPESPFSSVLGKTETVDTVRFPRTTLRYRSGDCDDTTALLASLLEAAGVRTAVLTSPGHVFLAFDTEEPEANSWMFRTTTTEVLSSGGSLWVPVETTSLSKGFTGAWQDASALVRRYAGTKELELIPLATARDRYPSLPLPPDGTVIVEPSPARAELLHSTSLSRIRDSLYLSIAGRLEGEMSSLQGAKWTAAVNQLGILHARFGEAGRAEETLRGALERDPGAFSVIVNLANLRLAAGDGRGALEYLRKGKELKPQSYTVDLLLARAYHMSGETAKAVESLKKVEEKNPELAARYAYISASASEARASRADISPPSIWSTEE